MSPAVKSILAVLVAAIAISGGWYWYWSRHNPISGPVPVPAQLSFDQFQGAMQDAVFKRYGGTANGGDFSVMVATPDADLGELIRPAGSLPMDQSDCAPNPVPAALPFDGVFPAYTLSSDAAVTANLGGQAADALAQLNTSLKSSSAVQFRVDNATIRLLPDNRIDQITGTGSCHDYISSHSGVRFVRGVVTGKVTYSVLLDHPADVKANLTQAFGSIDVQQDPDKTTVDISSNSVVPLVSMLSVFEVSAAPLTPVASSPTAAPPPPPPLLHSHAPLPVGAEGPALRPAHVPADVPDRSPASVPSAAAPATVQLTIHPATAPIAASTGTRIFVQADTSAPHTDAAAFVSFLQGAWPSATVVPQVEFVPSAKMPNSAQVRFFNAADEPLADKCLGIMKQKFPTARKVRIGLSAPTGQLEVWLPKSP
jgi:hypothetical protein